MTDFRGKARCTCVEPKNKTTNPKLVSKQGIIDMLRDRIETLGKSRKNVKGDPTNYAQYALQCAITEIEAGGYPRPVEGNRS